MGNFFSSNGGGLGSTRQRRLEVMSKYGLTEQQVKQVESLFKESASNKKYITFKDFRQLYAESRFDHDEEDILAAFVALANEEPPPAASTPKAGNLIKQQHHHMMRISFQGFVRLTRLCSRADDVNEDGVGGGSSVYDEDRMRVLFNVMDSDNSKTISESEFQRFILNFVDDPATASDIFGKLDHDNTREIGFPEFSAFCKSHRKIYKAMCSYVFPID